MEYTISDQELEKLRKGCKLRLTISIILAMAVYLAILCFAVWAWETRKWGRSLTHPYRKRL